MDKTTAENWKEVLWKSKILHTSTDSQAPKLLPLFLIKSTNFAWPITDAAYAKKDAADVQLADTNSKKQFWSTPKD